MQSMSITTSQIDSHNTDIYSLSNGSSSSQSSAFTPKMNHSIGIIGNWHSINSDDLYGIQVLVFSRSTSLIHRISLLDAFSEIGDKSSSTFNSFLLILLKEAIKAIHAYLCDSFTFFDKLCNFFVKATHKNIFILIDISAHKRESIPLHIFFIHHNFLSLSQL